jgi:hypothetical protein
MRPPEYLSSVAAEISWLQSSPPCHRPRWRDGTILRLLLPLLGAFWIVGCASVRVTDPDRTATEQMLLSNAVSRANDKLAFDLLRGRIAFLEAKYLVNPEQSFAVADLRAKMLLAGVQLTDNRDDAEIILEARTGGIGIDRYDNLIGIPSLQLSGGIGTPADVPLLTPEVAIIKSIKQRGYASMAFIAYWRETGEVVISSGPVTGTTYRDDWWFFGSGPRTVGDIPTTSKHDP